MRIQQNLPTPNGVQPSGTGSLNLPLGATYYSVWLDISDGATAMTQAEVEKRIARFPSDWAKSGAWP